MTFNELISWIVAKPCGRIMIERSESKRDVGFYLSCQAPSSRQVVAAEYHVNLGELRFLGGKSSVEEWVGRQLDAMTNDFEDILTKEKLREQTDV